MLYNVVNTEEAVTICIIKPDMIAKNKKDEVIEKIKARGYRIVEQRMVKFTEEMARDFYKDQTNDKDHFKKLVDYMTSGESCVLALSKPDNSEDVINDWRNDLGPLDFASNPDDKESFRAQYATDKMMNALHGSDSKESARREMAFFFPNTKGNVTPKNAKVQRTLALIRPSAFVNHKDAILKTVKDRGFTIAMAKTVNLDRKQAEQFYADQKDKPFFEDLIKEMTSGPLMVLCLAKEDAVAAWRSMLGPKEKEKVKEATGT